MGVDLTLPQDCLLSLFAFAFKLLEANMGSSGFQNEDKQIQHDVLKRLEILGGP